MSDPRISHEAGQQLWNRLAAAWRMSPDCEYWYPLAASDRDDVIAFQSTHFIAALGTGVLQRLLRERGVERVVEFREGGDTLELAVKDLDPEYGGEEGYWSSEPWDWIVFASHERSITVGGRQLIGAVQAAWPEWNRFVCGPVHRLSKSRLRPNDR